MNDNVKNRGDQKMMPHILLPENAGGVTGNDNRPLRTLPTTYLLDGS
jgi:hypothetical protein